LLKVKRAKAKEPEEQKITK